MFTEGEVKPELSELAAATATAFLIGTMRRPFNRPPEDLFVIKPIFHNVRFYAARMGQGLVCELLDLECVSGFPHATTVRWLADNFLPTTVRYLLGVIPVSRRKMSVRWL